MVKHVLISKSYIGTKPLSFDISNSQKVLSVTKEKLSYNYIKMYIIYDQLYIKWIMKSINNKNDDALYYIYWIYYIHDHK